MKLQSVKPVIPAESAKSGGLSKTEGKTTVLKTLEKSNINGKSNPAIGIKKPAASAGKSLNSASGIKNPAQGRYGLSSSIKSSSIKPSPAEPLPGKTITAKELFIKTAASLGFPKDVLSVALLVFARYFSVSLSPALMKTLRREVLASGKSSSPETPVEKTALEAEALSALIALDKGVVLSPQELEHYARFLSFPDENFNRQDDSDYSPADYSPEGDRDREESPEAEELRIIAEEQGQNDSTLAFLNHLPGKNGQHWLVFPFSIKVKGIEFQVFLRLLRKEPVSSVKGVSFEDGHLIVDISGPKKQWRCFLKKADEKFFADLRVYPGQHPKALKILQKEAEQILKEGRALFGSFKGFDEILVRNGEEAPSWAEDLCMESLPSINEQV
jgi:hypothetical protein